MVGQVKVIKSQRGKDQYEIGGYLFDLNKTHKEKLYIRCARTKQDSRCNVTAILEKRHDQIFLVKEPKDHHHEPISVTIATKVIKNKMKEKIVKNPNTSLGVVYRSVRNEEMHHNNAQPQDVATVMPTFESMKTILYRKRTENVPKLPSSLSEIQLVDPYVKTISGQNFILFDDGLDKKIIGFGTDESIYR
jgi:hypothetical protein